MTRRLRAAVPAVVLSLLALTGCFSQPEEANDNGPQPDPAPATDIVRTPVPVEDAPVTVPLPGETNSPDVSAEVSAEASPSAG